MSEGGSLLWSQVKYITKMWLRLWGMTKSVQWKTSPGRGSWGSRMKASWLKWNRLTRSLCTAKSTWVHWGGSSSLQWQRGVGLPLLVRWHWGLALHLQGLLELVKLSQLRTWVEVWPSSALCSIVVQQSRHQWWSSCVAACASRAHGRV